MQSIHHENIQDIDGAPEYRDTVRERRWDFAPGQMVAAIVGLGFVIVGVIAVARAGLEGSLADPVVTVMGYTHTAWLGIAEIVVGLLLLLAGLDTLARGAAAVLGALLVVAGVLIQAIPEDLPRQLALDEDMGMPLVIIGAVVAIAAMAFPAWRGRSVDRRVDLPH